MERIEPRSYYFQLRNKIIIDAVRIKKLIKYY